MLPLDKSKRKRKKADCRSESNLCEAKQRKNSDSENEDQAEFVDRKTIMENMLLLGCVIEIRKKSFLVSLPGCLVGTVPQSNVSDRFSELMNNHDSNENSELTLNSVIKLGMALPCRVMQVISENMRNTLILSINPKHVNGDLKVQSLYKKMVLYVSVSSMEDHGYVLDLGIKGTKGFLPFHHSSSAISLRTGQVIPACIKQLTSSNVSLTVVHFNELSFDDDFPKVPEETIRLSSILPGANVVACVTSVKHPFVYMKCIDFKACANIAHHKSSAQTLTVSSKVSGTVLYVNPVTSMIYLTLCSKPTPSSFLTYFGLKKYDIVQNIKFLSLYHNQAYFKIHKKSIGFIKKRDLEGENISVKKLVQGNSVIQSARVIFLHLMDNLIQLTTKRSVIESEVKNLEEITIGDTFTGVVQKHIENGMYVSLWPGVNGFVRQIHMSDIFTSKPDKLYPIGTKVNCRVLSLNPLHLTCKKSFLNLKKSDIPLSYDDIQEVQYYTGVIVKKTMKYFVISFFNNIQGIVPSEFIPSSSVFFEGQSVLCEALHCNPSEKKLKLSLMSVECASTHVSNVDNICEQTFSQIRKKIETCNTVLTDEACNTVLTGKSANPEIRRAVIKKNTGHEMDIILDDGKKGRIHITEIGCTTEQIFPLEKYSVGQQLKVYIIGKHKKHGTKYLQLTRPNIVNIEECSFTFPPPVSLNMSFAPGTSLIGFVKEACDASVALWLSPVHTGMLDYLHCVGQPKILRKLKKLFKIGLSVCVTILDVKKSCLGKSDVPDIILTKQSYKPPVVGQNIAGFVQLASVDMGLVLKLPFGYHGTVALTDIVDTYISAHALLEKYQNLQFVLCHVLSVNHHTKYCILSLRKSRLYNKEVKESKSYCAELTANDVKKGKIVKGFIKSLCNSNIIVNFGRALDGKVSLHKCPFSCSACKSAQSILQKCSVGSVVEVVIESDVTDGEMYLLSFPELTCLEDAHYGRLSVKHDITWDDEE